jgi:DNA-binding NarL/FixJ family response regulator
MYDDSRMICKAITLGANAYLLKTSDCEIIYDAIITCRKQWLYVNDVVRNALVMTAPKNSIKNEHGLGERELLILKLLSDGENSEMISNYIGLSERTVNAIINSLKEKAGVQTLPALLDYAKDKQLI